MPRGVRARGFADELERDLSLEPGVERSIDDTHAALPEQREDLERPMRVPMRASSDADAE
jgi:hypothetical protein